MFLFFRLFLKVPLRKTAIVVEFSFCNTQNGLEMEIRRKPSPKECTQIGWPNWLNGKKCFPSYPLSCFRFLGSDMMSFRLFQSLQRCIICKRAYFVGETFPNDVCLAGLSVAPYPCVYLHIDVRFLHLWFPVVPGRKVGSKLEFIWVGHIEDWCQ